jgi:MoaA/NifB/PqqE/SkfB family radical SAM enzyme
MRKPIAAATRYGRLLSPGAKMPVYLLMFVTNRCNAACDHCFYWSELNTKVKEELTIEEFDRLARNMGPMMQVTFTGGSPELRKDLPDIVERFYEHCRPTNMTFCMLGHSTNRIISHVEEMMRRCPDQKIKIGISLDGLHEEHDRLRKVDGLFDRACETIRELAKIRKHHPNLRIDVGMTVHGLNLDRVANTAKWVHDNLPIDVLKPILVRGDPLNPETIEGECGEVYHQIAERDLAWLTDTGEGATPFDYIVRAKERVLRQIVTKTSETGVSPVTCAGGRETAVIYPSGDVAGCELRDDVLGNVRAADFDFRSIWLGERAQQFRDTVGEPAACSGCYHHCFITPALFRTPKLWPQMVAAAWDIYRGHGGEKPVVAAAE